MTQALTQKQIRKHLLDILKDKTWLLRICEIYDYPIEKIFGAIHYTQSSIDYEIKWHGVSALGFYLKNTPLLKKSQIDEIYNRILWNLNEESGGIGWGMAELMGESMSVIPRLMDHHGQQLISFLIEDDSGADNYIEFDPLRTGAWWAVLRMSQVSPEMLQHHRDALMQSAFKEILFENRLYATMLINKGGWGPVKSISLDEEKIPDDTFIYHDHRLYANEEIRELTDCIIKC